jgi:hypothetical protein
MAHGTKRENPDVSIDELLGAQASGAGDHDRVVVEAGHGSDQTVTAGQEQVEWLLTVGDER